MSGSAIGGRKRAAAHFGMNLAEYERRIATGEKWCRACKAWHERSSFGSDRSRHDGLSTVCAASRVVTVVGPSRAARRDAAARGEAWCRGCEAWCPLDGVRSGVCREHQNAEWRAAYAANRDEMGQRITARRRGLAPIPSWWLEEIREAFDGLCAYGCGQPGTTIDHVWPVARGGKSCPGNLVPACLSCNSRKRDKDPHPWVLRGTEAFPFIWLDRMDLAIEHGTDQWLDEETA